MRKRTEEKDKIMKYFKVKTIDTYKIPRILRTNATNVGFIDLYPMTIGYGLAFTKDGVNSEIHILNTKEIFDKATKYNTLEVSEALQIFANTQSRKRQ